MTNPPAWHVAYRIGLSRARRRLELAQDAAELQEAVGWFECLKLLTRLAHAVPERWQPILESHVERLPT